MAFGLNLQQRESHDMNEAIMKNYEKTFMESVAVIHSKFEDAPTTVAFVEVNKNLSDLEKCEFAFKETNTIDKAWWENKSVTPMFDGASCRSTSSGDFVLIGNTKYKCAPVGWEKV